MQKKFYLTTPLYYVNSKPHIGHSYTNIASDVLARFQRLLGKEVLFLTGTDEHGQKVAKAAEAAGMEPQPFTDKMSQTFLDLWKTLHISYDDFIRTTERRHTEAVQRVWAELEKRGELYTAAYSGYYCTPCETFLTEEVVREQQSRGEAIVCHDCKRSVEKLEETNYFFRISKHQQWLIKTIEDGKDDKGNPFVILPETRRNEVLGFLRNNTLADLCISRPKSRLAWGIESPLSKDHVTYVWFDALINYISACGYPDRMELDKCWPADVHIIGKDILRHHAIYWPILLRVLEIKPPRMIFAHGWWVQGGQKMSKSLGNVTDPTEIVSRYGVDAYRYFLLGETPFGQDGIFSERALFERLNHDLANDLGNLVYRTLTMCEKYFDGKIPANIDLLQESGMSGQGWKYTDLRLSAFRLFGELEPLMAKLAFSEALQKIWDLISKANKYIEGTAPWTLFKEGKMEDLQMVILSLVESLRLIAIAVWPFMPKTGESILSQLALDNKVVEHCHFFQPDRGYFYKKGGRVCKGTPLFPKDRSEEGP